MTRSTWQHLRVPFSFYLLPVFFFACSQLETLDLGRAALVFGIIHLLVYPASNGFNSAYDRDTDSIGGLEHPPTVTADLLYTSLALDALALGLGFLLGWRFVVMLLVFGAASKAYSHPAIRLKARPWLGWLTVAVFQGGFIYATIVLGIEGRDFAGILSGDVARPAALSALLFGGAYPMTQIYQHAEDARRGDRTISRVLGIRGTFIFSGFLLTLSLVAFFSYFEQMGRRRDFYLLIAFVLPIATYTAGWFARVLRDPAQVTYRRTMILNRISASTLTALFVLLTSLGHACP